VRHALLFPIYARTGEIQREIMARTLGLQS
jgi:hypothetical protein